VDLAYLFGSQVNDSAGPISDVDLAILFEDRGDTLDARSKLAYELGKELQFHPIDIVSLREASIELAYGIISQGICIYQRDNALRVEFEAQVLSRYGDYLPVLRSQRQEILGEKGDDRRIQRYREAFRRTERTLSQIRAA
jgi:predicted nucleotidyltransferase